MTDKFRNISRIALSGLLVLGVTLFLSNCKDEKKPDTKAAAPTEQKKEFTGPGKDLFNSKGCVACHGFGTGDKPTGPDLKDATKRRDAAWLKKWIQNPTEMLKTDATAKELLKKFNNVPMPKVDLSDKEVEDIIAYMAFQDSGAAGQVAGDFKALSNEEFEKGKKIYFDRCSGCHGAKRWGATGPSLLPNTHIKAAKETQGGGTKSKGTESLEAILNNGTPGGMPAWGKEGVLNKEEMNLMARYIQMDPPSVPTLDLETAKKNWTLEVPVDKRPKTDPTQGRYTNYMGIVMRDAGKVAIIDGTSKKMLSIVDTGYAVHILRVSHSGRYFYSIGRDGKVTLIDTWYEQPKVVARGRTCWDARSIDSSKAPGYTDKYAIIGCYTPNQYVIMDGLTLEPISITSVADSKDWETKNSLPEVRVASIVASDVEPFWVINLKESGWVYLIDYRDPKNPKETRLEANNFLHDGGWINHPGSKDKRYFLVAANAKNEVCVVDTKEKKVIKPCVATGKVPHPGRGANFVHPKYGPVYATTFIGDNKLSFIGSDPAKRPKEAWKVVETHEIKCAGSLFVKTHPKSKNLWFDMPLCAKEGVNGEVGIYDIASGKIAYEKVSPKRIVHMEYNKSGDELWISGWLDNQIYVYDDKTKKLKTKLTGDWIKTPTGKFNIYNTQHDVY